MLKFLKKVPLESYQILVICLYIFFFKFLVLSFTVVATQFTGTEVI